MQIDELQDAPPDPAAEQADGEAPDRNTPADGRYYQPDAKQSIDEFQLAMDAAKKAGFLAADGQGDAH